MLNQARCTRADLRTNISPGGYPLLELLTVVHLPHSYQCTQVGLTDLVLTAPCCLITKVRDRGGGRRGGGDTAQLHWQAADEVNYHMHLNTRLVTQIKNQPPVNVDLNLGRRVRWLLLMFVTWPHEGESITRGSV